MAQTPAFITAANDFAHYAGYPLFILGTLANIMCIIVLARPKMRATNIGFYLIALSVNDLFVLNVSLMDKWLRHSHDIRLRQINLFLCKLLPFLDKFFLQMASWIVVAVSIERMFAVCNPIRYRNFGQWHRPLVLVIITLLIAGVNAPIFYYFELDTTCHTSAPKAYIQPKYVIFYLLYWLLPLLGLLISSAVIIYKLLKKNHVDTNLASPNNTTRKRAHKESIYILLFINGMFIVCISPFAICGILETVIDRRTESASMQQRLRAVYIVSHVFSYLNNATNFIPYMLMSLNFRAELKALFRIKNSR